MSAPNDATQAPNASTPANPAAQGQGNGNTAEFHAAAAAVSPETPAPAPGTGRRSPTDRQSRITSPTTTIGGGGNNHPTPGANGGPPSPMPEAATQFLNNVDKMSDEEVSALATQMRARLPPHQKQIIANQMGPVLGPPNTKVRDTIWMIVISAFVLVLLGTVATLIVSVFVAPASGTNATSPQTILAVFTSVTGFLVGLFVPSPVGQNNSGGQTSTR